MRVLIAGSQGYLGTVTAQVFSGAGHEVTGLDTCLFAGCVMGSDPLDPPTLTTDLRDITSADLTGFDAVVHLAALPVVPGQVEKDVNHHAAVRLGHAAKEAGVGRYLFASEITGQGVRAHDSLPGPAGLDPSPPGTEDKMRVEEEVAALSGPAFVPAFLRLATMFGFSPRVRSDLPLNRMVGEAIFTGEVAVPAGERIVRPMVHVRDAADAFLRCLTAPAGVVNRAVFDVGSESTTVTGTKIACAVSDEIPGTMLRASRLGGSGPVPNRVDFDFDRVRRAVGFEPRWGIADGVAELHRAYVGSGMDPDTFFSRFDRRVHLLAMQDAGEVDEQVRRQEVLV